MHGIGIDSPLNNLRGDYNAICGQMLNQRFGNDASAMIAPTSPDLCEIFGFKNVQVNVEIESSCVFKSVKTKETTCRTTSDPMPF